MPLAKSSRYPLGIGLILGWMLVCNFAFAAVATPAPSSSAPPTWLELDHGMAYSELLVQPSNAPPFMMQIVRFDPHQVQFRVHYQPTKPLTGRGWRQKLDGELALINGNFFDTQHIVEGLLVMDSQAYGRSYRGYGGMFAVDGAGMTHIISLVYSRANIEGITQAVQGYPMLVETGGVAARVGRRFDRIAQRSVIARSHEGYIYFISTAHHGQISLRDLQTWLLTSELNIDVALNLDGGRSQLFYVALPTELTHRWANDTPPPPFNVLHLTRTLITAVYEQTTRRIINQIMYQRYLPIVLAVYPR